jgi:hypothetical protein
MNFIKQEINQRRIENNKKIQHNICDRRTKRYFFFESVCGIRNESDMYLFNQELNGIPIAGVPPILTLIAFTLLLYNVKHQL